jgi:hypothetical protein
MENSDQATKPSHAAATVPANAKDSLTARLI